MRKITAFLAIVALCAPYSWGWNGKGHMVVAYIAYQHLDPGVRQRVNSLLQLNPDYDTWVQGVPEADQPLVAFMMAATWPDAIKQEHGYVSDGPQNGDRPTGSPDDSRNIGYSDHLRHKYWHFVDEPFSTDGTSLEDPPVPNASTEISLLRDALRNSSSNEIRSYDLVWLEHLVGDIHQPLHATSRFTRNHPHGDAGGNLVPICSQPHCKAELHALWDSILGQEDLQEAMSLGESLESDSQPVGVDDTNVDHWVQESFRLAKTEAYRSPISADEPNSTPGKPDRTYRENTRKVAESQVRLAGYRLAKLLSDALR